jgi:hypothetical protein
MIKNEIADVSGRPTLPSTLTAEAAPTAVVECRCDIESRVRRKGKTQHLAHDPQRCVAWEHLQLDVREQGSSRRAAGLP